MTLALSTPLRFLAIPPAELSLARVLQCGQSFRWTSLQLPASPNPLHEWSTAWPDRTVTLRQDGEKSAERILHATGH